MKTNPTALRNLSDHMQASISLFPDIVTALRQAADDIEQLEEKIDKLEEIILYLKEALQERKENS